MRLALLEMENTTFPLHLEALTNRQLLDTKFLLSSCLRVLCLYLPDCNLTCRSLLLLLFSFQPQIFISRLKSSHLCSNQILFSAFLALC